MMTTGDQHTPAAPVVQADGAVVPTAEGADGAVEPTAEGAKRTLGDVIDALAAELSLRNL